MAKKDDRKKQKKRLKEQKRATERRKYIAAIQRANRYPRIKVLPTGGDPELVAEIERLVSEFSFDDPECCSDKLQLNYQRIAAMGFEAYAFTVKHEVEAQTSSQSEKEAMIEVHVLGMYQHLGMWLFERLPPHFSAEPLPKYFFRTEFQGTEIRVRFDLLEAVGEPGNPLYIAPEKPTVVMQGARWQVGLYYHALERMCHRLQAKGPRSYTDNLFMDSVLTQKMLAYEPATLADGSHALRVDLELPLTMAAFDYYAQFTRRILDLPETHQFTGEDRLYRVLGYLPLQVQGKYARAKTFLLPGFANTPEYALGRRKARTPQERLLLQAMTDESRRSGELDGETVEAIKWYHDNGVPQIFRREQSSSESGR